MGGSDFLQKEQWPMYLDFPRTKKRYCKALDVLQANLDLASLCDSSDNLSWEQFCMFGTHEASCLWREEYTNQIEAILKTCFILWNFWSFLKMFSGKTEFAGNYRCSNHALIVLVMVKSPKFNVWVGTGHCCWSTFHLGKKKQESEIDPESNRVEK